MFEWLTPIANNAATVIGALGERDAARKAHRTEIRELEYLAARERREAAEVAAASSMSAINSDLVRNILIWTLTTIAGAVLVRAVFNWAR